MKKTIIKIIIGAAFFFVSGMLLVGILDDDDLGLKISAAITMIYFITLTVIPYVKNVCKYLKTGEVPEVSKLVILSIAFLAPASGKGIGTSLTAVRGAKIASDEFSKADKRISVLVYTLFYICLWSFLSFIFYVFVFRPENLNIISESLLSVSFISAVLAILIVLINGIIYSVKAGIDNRKLLKEAAEKAVGAGELIFGYKMFFLHYGLVLVILAVLGVASVIFTAWVVSSSGMNLQEFITGKFGNTAGTVVTAVVSILFLYLFIVMPAVLLVIVPKLKLQSVGFNPLRIYTVVRNERQNQADSEVLLVEKIYCVEKIQSYSISNSHVIVHGEINRSKRVNGVTKETKSVNKVKIPRAFKNEYTLINYLNEHQGK